MAWSSTPDEVEYDGQWRIHMTQIKSLIEAIQSGNAKLAEEILQQEPGITNQRSEGGASPMLLAIYHGKLDIAQLIVQSGHTLSIREAAAYGDLERVRELVEAEPELTNRVGSDGHLPLALSCFFLNIEIAKYLLGKGADVNAASQNNQRVTPLHAAAASQSVAITQMLLQHGADANARQNGGFTPLHSAAQNGQIDLIKLLLEHGAQPDVKADDGKTPLDLAEEYNHSEAANLIKSATIH
jgi:uncharacterized protein